jgi:pimeloyl-ACP methyl ester carboxylesterase
VIRAAHGAVRVPNLESPHDTVHFRLFHPAALSGDDAERLTGNVPPDPSDAPWPVVLMLPGINIGPEGYRWLAIELAERGCAVVTMALVGETMPGVVGITPGLDLEACRPEHYGTRPTATAVGPVLDTLAEWNDAGRFAGLLDLDRVVLAGHSGGGTVALQNANPDWFPGVVATFAYASHTMASTVLGYEPSTILGLPASLPTLLLAGEFDGVMARSADRYRTTSAGGQADGHDPVRRTFDEAVHAPTGHAHFAVLRGAVHTSMIWPPDPTSARGFLDPDAGRDPAEIRATMGSIIGEFVASVTGAEPATATVRLAALLDDHDGVLDSATR